MNPDYYIPEVSLDHQLQGPSKQRVFLGMVKLPLESTFKQIIQHCQSKQLLKNVNKQQKILLICIIINSKHALTREI